MAVLKRNLKPNPKGRYCPYLGCRVDDKQQRFNLGSDRAEAERRMNRLYELWEENVRANEEEVWSPLALHFAKRIAEGKRKIEYPFQSHFLGADDPAAEYTQMVHVERERFPSLDIVPADAELYAEGLRRNERLVGAEVEHPHSRLTSWVLWPQSKCCLKSWSLESSTRRWPPTGAQNVSRLPNFRPVAD
ncbi:MAG: hypothetical protein GY867_11020 [bacterium]|nr:hypothetical protein [bacterium]